MNIIKNIIFDFGGVLMDWNPRYLYKDLFQTETEMEYFLSSVCTNDWNVQQDAGISLEYATQQKIREFPEYEEMIRHYYGKWEIMLKSDIFANTYLVGVLKNKGYRLFGLTNWSAETFPIAYKRYSVFGEFEDIVVSGEEKLIKPDPEIYKLALQRFRINPEESLFIDDNRENIEAADALGIQTIHLNDALLLKEELEKLQLI